MSYSYTSPDGNAVKPPYTLKGETTCPIFIQGEQVATVPVKFEYYDGHDGGQKRVLWIEAGKFRHHLTLIDETHDFSAELEDVILAIEEEIGSGYEFPTQHTRL